MRVCLWHAQLQARVARVAATSKPGSSVPGFVPFCAAVFLIGPQRLVHRFLCEVRYSSQGVDQLGEAVTG